MWRQNFLIVKCVAVKVYAANYQINNHAEITLLIVTAKIRKQCVYKDVVFHTEEIKAKEDSVFLSPWNRIPKISNLYCPGLMISRYTDNLLTTQQQSSCNL